MVEDKPSKDASLTKAAKARADRLAAALRDNLKRRKAQARAQAVEPAAERPGSPAKEGQNQ